MIDFFIILTPIVGIWCAWYLFQIVSILKRMMVIFEDNDDG